MIITISSIIGIITFIFFLNKRAEKDKIPFSIRKKIKY